MARYVVRDHDGNVVQEFPVEEGCGDTTCGGCSRCLAAQAVYSGLVVEVVEED